MDADYDEFEIARVIHGFKLIDSESYERQYRLPLLEKLVPGYYVVHWPGNVKIRRFDHSAVFHGPFEHRREAQLAAQQMRVQANTVAFGNPLVSRMTAAARSPDTVSHSADRWNRISSPPANIGAVREMKLDVKPKLKSLRTPPLRSQEGGDSKTSATA